MKLRRRLAKPARLTVVLAAVLGSISLPAVIRATPAVADTATTVTGGFAWQWDPNDLANPGQLNPSPRTVTVDQTTDLVSQVVHVSWSNFSASSAPSALSDPLYPVRVYQCDTVTPTDPSHCFGSLTYNASHPGYGDTGVTTNMVGAVTSVDGTGGIDFPVLTGADNPSLGCSPVHACSLLIEPYGGGDSVGPDADGNKGLGDPNDPHPNCDDHSLDFTVDPNTYVGNLAHPAGGLSDWDTGCAWAGRIVVPLHFAPTPTDCPQRSADFRAEGSPLLQRAIDQWRSGICRNGNDGHPLQVGYSPLSEYQARDDFQAGTTDVALTSQPSATSTRPSSYAPVGVSTIAIAYYVDNATTGKPMTDLRLDARLLAKMLTQSYTNGLSANCADKTQFYACAPEVAGNPTSLYTDPEFLQLNPGHTAADFPANTAAASSPTVVFGDSDQTYQLTRWIESDPSAAAFLDGQRDQWGMRVNTAYLPPNSPTFPISQFTASDPGHTITVPSCDGANACLNAGLQNTWFPVAGLRNVAKTLLAGKDSGKSLSTSCQASNVPAVKGVCQYYAGDPASPQGARSAFAIVSGADAASYRFPTARLQTRGGAFVADTTDAAGAALADMTPNADKVTQQLNYSTLRDPAAYPLTAITYAQVPSCGLSAVKGEAIANFLRYTASDQGNVYGVQPGQLAPGYLALPAALRTRTAATANQLIGQAKCSSATSGSRPPAKSIGGPTSNSNGPGTAAGSGNGDSAPAGSTADGSTQSGAGGDGATGRTAAPAPVGLLASPAAFAQDHPDSAGIGGAILPILLITGAALLVLGPAAMVLGGTAAGAALQARARGLLRLR